MISGILWLLRRFRVWLASVTAVEVGKPDDGLKRVMGRGTELDRSCGELRQGFEDALAATWENPLAKRLVGIVTAYVVGVQGVRLWAPGYKLFDAWIKRFM